MADPAVVIAYGFVVAVVVNLLLTALVNRKILFISIPLIVGALVLGLFRDQATVFISPLFVGGLIFLFIVFVFFLAVVYFRNLQIALDIFILLIIWIMATVLEAYLISIGFGNGGTGIAWGKYPF